MDLSHLMKPWFSAHFHIWYHQSAITRAFALFILFLYVSLSHLLLYSISSSSRFRLSDSSIMAPDGVEEAEYDSDPEELKRFLAPRRREEASDDEELEGLKDDDHNRVGNQIDSDQQSYGIAESDDDADQGLLIEGDSYDEEDEEGDFDELDDDIEYITDKDKTAVAGNLKGNGEDATEDSATDLVDGEEPKKKEPFAVPTAGAFYMHDDRSQEMDTASNRLTIFFTPRPFLGFRVFVTNEMDGEYIKDSCI